MDFSVLAWRCIGIAEPVQVHGFTKSRLSLLSRQYRARLNGNGDGKKKSPSRYLFAHAVLSSAILRQNPQRVLAVDSGELRRAQSGVLQLLDVIDDGAVRIISVEHDLRRADETLQRAELQKIGHLRRVVIEAPQMVQLRVGRGR